MTTRSANTGPLQPLPLKGLLKRAWAFNPTLTFFVLASAVIVAGGFVSLMLDPRLVVGAPNWAKTTKFAISFVIYGATFLWMLSFVPNRPRLVRFIGITVGAVLLLEMALILFQAARGQAMHFNVATPLDAAL